MSYSVHTEMSWSRTMDDIEEEMKHWGITQWETNYPRGARLQGRNQSEQDRTVILSYNKNGKSINLKMGNQSRAVDNLRVLYLAIHDMRMNEKRGLAEVLESAYLQLAGGSSFDPYQILQIMPDAPLDVAEASFRARAKTMHPDRGGSIEEFQKLQKAIEEIRKEKHGD